MQKIFLNNSFKANASTSSTSRSVGSTKRSENPEVSSRWDKVSSKERRQENDREEDGMQVGQNLVKKPSFVGSPNKIEDKVKTHQLSSPFDLFKKGEMEALDAEPELAGLQGMPFVDALEDHEKSAINFFVDAEKSDLAGVGLVPEKKESPKISLHEDLSFISANAAPTHIAALHGVSAEVAPMRSAKSTHPMEELAARLIDEINIVKQNGRTDTTIHLKNAGIFTDAQVTLTEFDTAKNEFNIRFENLSRQAHEILSMHTNRESLRVALEQKGYNVHIITANTQIEQAEHVYQPHQDRREGDRQQDQQHHREQEEE